LIAPLQSTVDPENHTKVTVQVLLAHSTLTATGGKKRFQFIVGAVIYHSVFDNRSMVDLNASQRLFGNQIHSGTVS
jgi:hypothetical protein